MAIKILAVDDEQDFLDSIKRGLLLSGFSEICLESDPRRAAKRIEEGEAYDLALLDITMPAMTGIELLEIIKRASPGTECIMITAANEARVAVECLHKGAYDYLVKPITRDDLILAVNRALERKRLIEILEIGKRSTLPDLKHGEAFEKILTRQTNVFKVLKEAELHAASIVPVLITGESGTGKELLARAIHAASPRAARTFTAVNMASLTGTLFDAEFFGHTKGAFTGADRERVGLIEASNRGSMFLDEIGHLSLELQGKLLRVLQEGEFLKIGTNKPQKVDIRFITATNVDLHRMMERGEFRNDLFYRLRGAWLHLPPLRERRDDIPLLVKQFQDELWGGEDNPGIEEDALIALMNYNFPGNIRELRSIVHSAMNLAQGQKISLSCLSEELRKTPIKKRRETSEYKSGEEIASLAEVEKDHIINTYRQTDMNKCQTAKILGIGLNTLRRKLNQYGME